MRSAMLRAWCRSRDAGAPLARDRERPFAFAAERKLTRVRGGESIVVRGQVIEAIGVGSRTAGSTSTPRRRASRRRPNHRRQQ
jgi:uncharacterized protein GlcG (DUF336 family)